LMDGVEEQNELEREINDVLVNTGETLTGIEEDELELELQALMGGTGSVANAVEAKIELPVVPTEKLPENETQKQPVKEKTGRVAVAS